MEERYISQLPLDDVVASNDLFEKETVGGLSKSVSGQAFSTLAETVVNNILAETALGHTIEDEGSPLPTRTNLDFVGTGVTVTDDEVNDKSVVTIAAGGHTVQDEGTPLTQRTNLNFVGPAVVASDDNINNATVITIEPKVVRQTVFTIAGVLAGGAGTVRIYNKIGHTITISKVFLSVSSAPTTQAIIVDVNKNGVTIFTNQANRPQIAAGAFTGYTNTIDISTLVDGDYLTVDLDQVGSGTAGSDLTIHIIYDSDGDSAQENKKVFDNGSTVTGHLAVWNANNDHTLVDGGSVPLPTIVDGPQGIMTDGMIVPTVSSGNLTLTIKRKDGTDPSSSNPVNIVIGNVRRVLTFPLSVTLNAATNWMNLGGLELATQTVDLFAYIGYNAIDGLTLGIARFPWATKYSDFSVTSNNEKYAGISTIANATATDPYEVIGRFAAILSGAAAYTWSVPTFDNSNLIQRPIYETQWRTYSPQASAASGSITSYTSSGVYYIHDREMSFQQNVVITNKGTGAGALNISLPFSILAVREVNFVGRETVTFGGFLSGFGGLTVANLSMIAWFFTTTFGTPIVNNYNNCGNGVVRIG